MPARRPPNARIESTTKPTARVNALLTTGVCTDDDDRHAHGTTSIRNASMTMLQFHPSPSHPNFTRLSGLPGRHGPARVSVLHEAASQLPMLAREEDDRGSTIPIAIPIPLLRKSNANPNRCARSPRARLSRGRKALD